MDHFHRFFQNLHGPQVLTCIGKLCSFTCSANVPKLPASNASATASLDEEALEDDEALEDPSRGGAAGGDPSRGAVAGGDPSRGGAAGGDSSRSGVPDATDEGVGDLGAGEEDAATDSATGVAADSATEAADSATEDNVATSEGDAGADAADDGVGVWGCTEEQGVEGCEDESDIADRTHPKQLEPQSAAKRSDICFANRTQAAA